MGRVDIVIDARGSAAAPALWAIPGVVDVWRADLSAAAESATADGLMDLLCEEERARAARIAVEHRRVLWARSRGMLRALLGRYLEADPRELRFALGAHGKPALYGDAGGASGLRFNLSHSGELMLVAVTAGREVGVDVELVSDRRPADFLREWTVREAIVKCLGVGLGAMRAEAGGYHVHSCRTPCRAAASEGDLGIGQWTAAVDVGPRAVATVAVQGGEACELSCRTLADEAQVLYSNGSSPASSLRRGAAESRSETISSETGSGHSIAMSGSSQAIPRSIAGS